ncbi:MAG: hypothetical protein A3F12_03730 [Gammaproteobacteria bacterium RIFCSPHIGHO2_12_FULL_38_14]|nr:MAG: hypothetical protein A3F12_03730 [Gammaproteobacteria bacterium RIFCSPHIGHO2_12_FULL_38_14]
MNILCITPWFPRNDHEQYGNFILDSVEALSQLGHEVTVLVTEPFRPGFAGMILKEWKKKKRFSNEILTQFNVHHCRYLSIPRNYFISFSNWAYRKRVVAVAEKLLAQNKFDLIHAHAELSGVAAVDLQKKFHIPTAITLHGVSTEKKFYKGRTRKIYYDYAASLAARLILVGEPLLNFIEPLCKRSDHIRIVSNGFRLSPLHKNTSKKSLNETKKFISVSNLIEGKGIEINLQALAKLKKVGISSWHYTIIGDGPDAQKLKKLAHDLDLNEHVQFIGQCDHDKVYEYLNESDIFMLPSYREAFGIAYIEAMSLGLLTIAVEGQGPSSFIEHGFTGLLVKPRDSEALFTCLNIIFDNKENVMEIAERGRQYVLSNYTWRHHAQSLEKIFMEMINE